MTQQKAALDPHSEVVDEKRKWTPDWYDWFHELSDTVVQAQSDIGDLETALVAATSWVKFKHPVVLSAGLSAGSYDGTRFYVNGGTLSDVDGLGVYSTDQTSFPYMIDVGSLGLQTWSGDPGGTGSQVFSTILGGMVDGVLPSSGATIYPFAVKRDSDNLLAFMGTTHLDYAWIAPRTPAGWTRVRYLPFAIKYLLARGPTWNGLPQFLVNAYTNLTFLTQATDGDGTYRIGSGGFTGSGNANLGNLVDVNTSRMALVAYQVSHDGTTAGSGIAKIGGFTVGQVAIGQSVYGEKLVVFDSGATFPFSCDPGVILTMWVKGWWFIEIP